MEIRVESIPDGGKALHEEIDPATIDLDEPYYSINEPLTFTGHATRNGDDIYVKGRVTGAVKSECGRCLESFAMQIDLPVDAVFVPQRENVEDDDEVFEPQSNLTYYEGDSVDLLREIKDIILVNLPIKPVCRTDCKGLCPQCGTDLNKGSCTCKNHKGPSPFDKLKELKTKL
jgi:uncharacterized protein